MSLFRNLMLAGCGLVLAGGCKQDEAPPADPTQVPAEATGPDAPLVPPPSAAVIPPEEIAKLALIVAEIDCTAVQFEDPAAHDKAIEAILMRAGLSQDQYSDRVMKVIDDPTFKAVRERSAEMCRTQHAAAVAGGGADAEVALRENLRALAVASECMRKSGATSEEQAQAMLALYGAHHLDLATYTREMSKLANNRAFQEEVARETAKCPDAPPPADTPDTVTPEVEADTAAPPEGEEITEAPPTEQEPDAVVEAPKATIAGVYLGTVTPGGSLRVGLTARAVGVATATIDGLNFRMTGRVQSGDNVSLSASAGDHWVQMRGHVDTGKRVLSGTWSGVLNGRKKSGTFSAKR